jgi:hypothetical protein
MSHDHGMMPARCVLSTRGADVIQTNLPLWKMVHGTVLLCKECAKNSLLPTLNYLSQICYQTLITNDLDGRAAKPLARTHSMQTRAKPTVRTPATSQQRPFCSC